MTFRIEALDHDTFRPLFALDADALAAHGGEWAVADSRPGFPCRVSLRDADVGERLLLVNFEHLPANSPYRSRHAIFVRADARTATPAAGEVPESIQRRLLSLRVFDDAQRMLEADVVDGRDCSPIIERLLARPGAHVVHIHTARQGCYLARAVVAP